MTSSLMLLSTLPQMLEDAAAAFVRARREEYEKRVVLVAQEKASIHRLPPPSPAELEEGRREAREAYERVVAYLQTRLDTPAWYTGDWFIEAPERVEFLVPSRVISRMDAIGSEDEFRALLETLFANSAVGFSWNDADELSIVVHAAVPTQWKRADGDS